MGLRVGRRCMGTVGDGERCENHALPGGTLCAWHAVPEGARHVVTTFLQHYGLLPLLAGAVAEGVVEDEIDAIWDVMRDWLAVVAAGDELVEGLHDLQDCLKRETGRHARVSGKDFREADLRGADLSQADLSGADLTGATLSMANLKSARLTDADLREADLRNASLHGANLRKADLSEAHLCRADLTEARLRHADLREAKLKGVHW